MPGHRACPTLRSSGMSEEGDSAALDLTGPVEKSEESTGDGGRVGAILGEGLGGNENEPGVRLPGGPVLGVHRHEVLDVGRNQRTSGCCRVGEYLVVG